MGGLAKSGKTFPPGPLQRNLMQEGMESIDISYGGERVRGEAGISSYCSSPDFTNHGGIIHFSLTGLDGFFQNVIMHGR